MTESVEFFEQRKHKRYQVPSGSFVALGTGDAILGQIIDISMGGLAFRYIDTKELAHADESYLDIFMTEHNLCLIRVPFKTISEYEIANTVVCKMVDGIPPGCRSMRRGGVEFGELTSEQRAQLEYCIQNHTMGEV